jgi:glycosyltransferase involved in cell wall biosynthesis
LDSRPPSDGRRPPTGVAHIALSFGFGGAERVAAHLAARAAARGEAVRLCCPRGGRAQAGLEREVSLPVEGARAARPDEPNRTDLLRVAADAVVRLRGASVVHLHLPWPDRLGAALLARGRRPAVLTFHLLPERGTLDRDLVFGARPVPWLSRAAARMAPLALVALTEGDRARLAAALPGLRVVAIPNAPLAPSGSAPAPLPFGPGLRLLAVGRLGPQKGFDRLLDALAGEPARAAAWSLCVLGEGEDQAELIARAGRAGLGARVRFVGAYPAGHAHPQADLFVTASRSEGMPLALLEAMSAGLPVLASPIPAHREVLSGLAGALLPEDPRGWPAALARLLGDAPLRRRLGAAARERVRERFSVERQERAYAALYRELCAR